MKLKNIFPITGMVLVLLLGSCAKEQLTTIPENNNIPLTSASTLSSSSSFREISKVPSGTGTGMGPATGVNLGLAASFTILSKSGITDVHPSAITGDIGSSPITGAAILVNCTEVTGAVYSVDAAGPMPCVMTNATRLTTAVSNMETAYTHVAGLTEPNFINLGAGNIGGKTLSRGLYKWTSSVTIPTNVTISGGPNDVWIFQIAGTLTMSSDVKIFLSGGAQAKNIYWQTAGAVTLGTSSHFEGTILGKTGINLQTGASVNGRLLAQTAVTLQMNTVTKP
ncbi:MAG: hypothetical protein JWN78_1578 [Bacteroidota bacterium]|nr:hypothetical protein [Bacteroidota bacterium]